MSPKRQSVKRERTYVTFRLVDEDYELLRDLAGSLDMADRHEALEHLASIVLGLDLPDIRGQRYRGLRIGIPASLQRVLNKKHEETGQPVIRILLAAAKQAVKDVD